MCEEMEIYAYLKEKGIYTEVDSCLADGIKFYIITIDWGDWKHEHSYCNYLMKERGFYLVKEEVTEEDGSDCYSGKHYFVKSEIVADPD